MSHGTGSQGEPEYLDVGDTPPRRPRRVLLLAVAATVTVALGLPLGAFAVLRLLGATGPQPHDVLPANALAYVRVDLDPSGPEKVRALRFLRTFPAFEARTGIDDDRADVREALLDATLGLGACGLDYDDDVAGWLGERVGAAVTPPPVTAPPAGARRPGLVVAVQVRDEPAARRGLRALARCADDGRRSFGWAFLDGYAIVAETRPQAELHAAAAARSPLAERARFAADMRLLGEQGVASVWFSGEDLFECLAAGMVGDPGPAGSAFDRLRNDARRAVVRDYRSGAVAFRFGDGYAELAAVLTGTGYREPAGSAVADVTLPGTTAVALGVNGGAVQVERRWPALRALLAGHAPVLTAPFAADDAADRIRRLERRLGLRLPGDLRTLVGDSVTLAVDGTGLGIGTLAAGGLPGLDLGARVRTDVADLTRVVRRLEATAARHGVPVDVVVRRTDRGAVVALNQHYAGRLADGGGALEDTDVFRTAVPDAGEAQAVLFVNVDALEVPLLSALRLAGVADAATAANLTRLQALGVTGRVHDGYAAGALRLTVGE
jgi:Protein of unknown function (DUF3352)